MKSYRRFPLAEYAFPVAMAIFLFVAMSLYENYVKKDEFTVTFLTLLALAISFVWRLSGWGTPGNAFHRMMRALGDIAAVALALAAIDYVKEYPNTLFKFIAHELPAVLCGLYGFVFFSEE
ncbi:hypothetical protein SAMN05216516_11523 [Izhakiella capsodis]|uniref:Uncharacterized protein n=1 Tax=Izhakiella capsodis TaxID=1367852 RepID=A0A1I5B908_9GAMM|nr:hypothetical protein [Izhakiella capsodis]SFN71110.1 hypothetical protein SAMN05216516_11523 [Izhakiella capsodis]